MNEFTIETVDTKDFQKVMKSAISSVKKTYSDIDIQARSLIMEIDTAVISSGLEDSVETSKGKVVVDRNIPEGLPVINIVYPLKSGVKISDVNITDIEQKIKQIKKKGWNARMSYAKDSLKFNIALGSGKSGIVAMEHIDSMIAAIESEDQDAFDAAFGSAIQEKAQVALAERKIDLTAEIFNKDSE